MNVPVGRRSAACCQIFTSCGIVGSTCVDRLEMRLAFEICCWLDDTPTLIKRVSSSGKSSVTDAVVQL
jgi:hypothetical protein